MKPVLTLVACTLFFCISACKKDKRSPIDQLPPATESGKNTFGCLINGQAWLPKGSFPLGSLNPVVSYDPAFENGTMVIEANRIDNGQKVSIRISGKEINGEGVYILGAMGSSASQIASISDRRKNCYYHYQDDGTYCKGTLEITKLAPAEKVIAGKFSFTIFVTGCDTLKVTDGRFDLRLY